MTPPRSMLTMDEMTMGEAFPGDGMEIETHYHRTNGGSIEFRSRHAILGKRLTSRQAEKLGNDLLKLAERIRRG